MRSLLWLSLLRPTSSSFTSRTLSDVGEGRAAIAGTELPGGWTYLQEWNRGTALSLGVGVWKAAEPLTSSPLPFPHSPALSETWFCFLLRPISAFLLSPVEDTCTFWRLKGSKWGSSMKTAAVGLLVGV